MGKLAKLVGNAASGVAPGNATPGSDRESIYSQGMVTSEEPQQKPKTSDLDPRPDLAEDHRDWMAVLAVAKTEDLRLHGLLHGLRCGGARLELRDGAKGQYYRIDYKPLLEVWDEQELRRTWLEPYQHQIKQVLDRGLNIKRAADRSFAGKKAKEGAAIDQKEYRQASLWGVLVQSTTPD